jgi:hypothetical protein
LHQRRDARPLVIPQQHAHHPSLVQSEGCKHTSAKVNSPLPTFFVLALKCQQTLGLTRPNSSL